MRNELLGIDFFGRTDGIHTAISNLDAWINRIGKQDELAVRVLSHEILMALGGIHRESLDVWISLIVGIVKDSRPDLVLIPFL